MKKLLSIALLFCLCASGPLLTAHAAAPTKSHVLWKNADGTVAVWNVATDGTYISQVQYGPFPGWTATSLSESSDGLAHLIWTHSSGTIALWNLNADGTYVSQIQYGPFGGWNAAAISGLIPPASGPAGGDLTGAYPNPTVKVNAINHTKLAFDGASLAQVSGGLLSNPDGFHTYVLHDLIVQGTVVAVQGNGGGNGNNSKAGRALVDGGPNDVGLIINFANDFGRVSVQSELDVHGPLGLEPGDIYANNDINIHKNTTVHGNFGVDGAVNLGDGNINSANDINVNKNTTVRGTMTATTVQITGGSDLAEPYKIAASADVKPLPGMIVSIDPDQTGQMRVCARAYDTTVGGIISGANGIQPGVVLRQAGTVADGTLPIASIGRVWCYCDADAGGAITPGDLLTTSATPGHAMRVGDYGKARGAVLGKAMSSLKTGKGLVLVLVSLQ